MFKHENEYIDSDLAQLKDALGLIDTKLKALSVAMGDSFNEGIAEQITYYVGLGFTAIQRYISDITTWVEPDMTFLVQLGPMAKSGYPVMQIINAGANWWKHEADCWRGHGFRDHTYEPIAATTKINTFLEYTLANTLFELTPCGELTLLPLVPMIESWRDEVMAQCVRLNLTN